MKEINAANSTLNTALTPSLTSASNAALGAPFRLVLFSGLLLATLLLATLIEARAEPRRLLERAQRIAALTDWKQGYGAVPWDRKGNSYYWITNNQLLIFRSGDIEKGQDNWRLFRLDTTTFKETPLPALSARFNQTRGVHGWHSVSPDGKWLLWIGNGYCAALLNGSRFQ